jgi:hypothetical protein
MADTRDDTRIVRIQVTTTTWDEPDAGTDDIVKVHLLDRDRAIIDSITLAKPNYDDRQPGQTDKYEKLLSGLFKWEAIQWFRLQIYGHNAWLPEHIMIELTLFSNETKIACHYSNWLYWLSKDKADGNGSARPSWDMPILKLGAILLPESQPIPSFSEGDIVDPRTGTINAE